MVSNPSNEVKRLKHLLTDAQGVSLIVLDRDLHISFATAHAVALCKLQPTASALPSSLRKALKEALESNRQTFIWHSEHADYTQIFDVHLSHTRDAHGHVSGHHLQLLDAAPRIEHETHLRRNNEILNVLVSIDLQLQSAASWKATLPETIAQIGAVSGYSRIQVFQKHLDGHRSARLNCLHQWDATDVASHATPPQEPLPVHTRWLQRLRKNQPVFGTRTVFPSAEQQILESRQTEAVALVPVFCGGEWWGMISFEDCNIDRRIDHTHIEPLLSVGRSLGIAVQRQTVAERLEQARIAFDSTVEGIMICDEKKHITAVNKGFSEITGYGEDEAIGRTPELLSSGKNSREFYAAMWQAITKDGYWRGELWNRRKNGEIYPQWLTVTSAKNHEGLLTHYVAVFADISEAKISEQRAQYLVNHDPLTGLPNRRLLNELLDQAIKNAERNQHNIGLLFIDLDRFKSVNDTLGHHAGDILLSYVTQRLSDTIRECDTVARLSGDEFIVMMDSLKHSEDAAIVARKVISALQQSFMLDDKEVFIGASVGISIYPQDGLAANDLIKAADIAMYQAKHDGRNDYRFYTSNLGETAQERLTLDTMLRHALNRNELVVHYQPQISLATGNIIGAEALIRWQHPELGMIPPGKFIPLAEETGLIIPIGEWVLRQAAYDLIRLEETGLPLEWISVNVSAMQIHRSNFADTVYGVLVESGCDPEKLELEITESAIMNSVEYVIEVSRKLKGMGVRLALDDFGTGYSSLSYLKRFPLDKLKIDQSFVRDLPHDADDAVISGAIIGLGHNLGLKVIAEGVEKAEQEQFLREKGCEEAQGFLYSRPVPFTTLLELIASRQVSNL